MSITSVQSGTQSATLDTEHFLGGAISTAGAYVLVLNLSNLTYGDTIILRMYTRINAASTLRIAYETYFSGPQLHPVTYSPVVPIDATLLCSITQTDGTGRNFEWNILKLTDIVNVSGATQTATISTEHSLGAAVTTPGTYILVTDLSNMATNDIVRLRIKTKPKSGSASTVAFEGYFSGQQYAPNTYSVPVPIDTEIACTLTQTAGTGRSYEWNLLSL